MAQSHASPKVSPVLQQLADQVQATVGVEQSAVTYIQGEANRVQAAVNAAIANGATAEQLAPITDEIAAMKASAAALSAAIASNPTP